MKGKRISPEESKAVQQDLLVQEVLTALRKNQMEGCFVRNREEALKKVLSLIPEGSKVGFGGSLTLDELGIKDVLRKGNYQFIDRGAPDLSAEEVFRLRRESLLSDVFLCSTNAITRDGKLVNIDGIGNRLAAVTFGPKKVIVVAGMNKVVKTLDQAMDRIKNYATPLHTRRRGKNLPCAKTGACTDCRSPERICCIVTIHEFSRVKDRITVILVGENLGL